MSAKTFRLSILLVSLILLGSGAFASAKQKESDDIELINKYFASLNSIESDFLQIDDQGLNRRGKFYVSKPNRLKIQYDDDDKESIIMNDDILILYNPTLEETNYLSDDDIPLSLFSERNFNLKEKAEIINFQSDEKTASIEFILKNDPSKHKVEIAFAKNPIYIKQISVKEDDSKVTIIFNSPKFNVPVEAEVFDIP